MGSGNVWLWAAAAVLALWFARDAVRWLRAGIRGASSCDGRGVEPGRAYRMAAFKASAALAVPGCLAIFALGGSAAWVIAGPPMVILLSYLADRQWYRSPGTAVHVASRFP